MDRSMESAGDLRILALAPTARDAATTEQLLRSAGIIVCVCDDLVSMCAEAEQGAAALLVTEEALTLAGGTCIQQLLARQPAWSDLPLLVLTHHSDTRLVDFSLLGNVTLLDRPVRIATLVSAVKTAIRSRERQYQLREHLLEQERAREALRDADRRKDEFLAMLAHELRNPLAAIVAASAVLRECGTASPIIRRQQEVIDRQSRHTARLIDDLLDVSRITRGRIELRRQAVPVSETLTLAVENCRAAVAGRDQILELSLPEASPYVYVDVARFEQVVTNLLTNASKYSGKGGTIRVSLEARITPAGTPEIVISVKDTGAGIAPDLLPRIFDLFVQAERTLARSEGGLGIGLTMVRRLVELHEGRVEARSGGLGQGSEFLVYLPALASSDPRLPLELKAAPHEQSARRGAKTILVVEDNQDAAQSIGELLELWGHRVCLAADGEAALELVAAVQPDLVLLDIGLPGIDGYEVAARMRRSELSGHTTLIALTGYGREADRVRARAAGFDRHLTKPIDPDQLRSTIS